MKLYLGIDIGGSSIKYGLYNEMGDEVEKIDDKIKTPKYNLAKLIDVLLDIISKFKDIEGIGISVPGCIDSKAGYISNGGAVRCLDDVYLKNVIEEAINIKVEIENDANCALLAEKWIGNATDCENFICMTIGTGIGGALYLNNHLIRGHNYFAGEFGYMILDEIHDKFRMKTLNKDSGTIPFTRLVAKEKGLESNEVTGEQIFQMIESGDIEVIKMYKKWIRRLAVCIYNLGFILDPQKILIGGGISSESKFISDLKWEIESISVELVSELGKLESLNSKWQISACKYFNDSGKIGAIYNYMLKNNN